MIDERNRALIREDMKTCRERIRAIVDDPRINYQVTQRNYLNPEMGKSTRMTNPEGSLCYYAQLENALERILRHDRFIPEEFDFHLPAHLEGLYPQQRRA